MRSLCDLTRDLPLGAWIYDGPTIATSHAVEPPGRETGTGATTPSVIGSRESPGSPIISRILCVLSTFAYFGWMKSALPRWSAAVNMAAGQTDVCVHVLCFHKDVTLRILYPARDLRLAALGLYQARFDD